MAFLLVTKSRGIDYYTIAESYRDHNGNVKRRRLEYIGNFTALKEYVVKGYHAIETLKSGSTAQSNKPPPKEIGPPKLVNVKTYSHGSSFALLLITDLLNIENLINNVIDDNKIIKGYTRGKVLVLAAIQRVIKPGSKRAFAQWSTLTSLPYLASFAPKDMSSQTFWEAMNEITVSQINTIWNNLICQIIAFFDEKPRVLHLDYTNYYTFIDSNNKRCTICKRGKNKQKRNDLRQFSVAVLTSYSLQLPIIWEVYEGNINDKTEFSNFTGFIIKQLSGLNIPLNEVTICFDGGSNSEDNFKNLPFHIICAHSMVSFPELYEIDLDQYSEVNLGNGKKRLAYRIDDLKFSGILGTGILTFSEKLKQGQVEELEKMIKTAIETCASINERLKKPNSKIFSTLKKEQQIVERQIKDAVEYNKNIEDEELISKGTKKKGRRKQKKPIPEWNEKDALNQLIAKQIYSGREELKQFTDVRLCLREDNIYFAVLIVVPEAKECFIRKRYGKKLTCTEHKDWTTEQILRKYCEQECIETSIFKISKAPEHHNVRPQFHWTDQKIILHVFCCLLGMVIAGVLEKIMMDKNAHVSSRRDLLNTLGDIRDGWGLIQDSSGRLIPQKFLEDMTPKQQEMWQTVLEIKRMIDTGEWNRFTYAT